MDRGLTLHALPLALPTWPRELERQFHRWCEKEPWWTRDDLRYVWLPSHRGDEPQPALPPGCWGRFFCWRWQCGGYGTQAYAWTLVHAAVTTETRLSELQRALACGQVGLDVFPMALGLAIQPFIKAFETHPLDPAALFHRNTQRKLRRLRLLA